MSKRDTKQVLNFLAEKWANQNCPMCQKGPWEVQEKIFQLSEFHEGNFIVGGPLVPVVPVTCTNCGNTVLINAIVAGAISPEDKSPETVK